MRQPPPAVQSPAWWRDRLYKQLVDRTAATDIYDDYYECNHRLPHLHEKAREPFKRLLRMSRANYCELVVNALAGRLEVAGFQSDGDDEKADDRAWRLWQENNLDGGSQLAFVEAAIRGTSYLMVSPLPNGSYQITPEHPTQVIVAYRPDSPGVPAAALKLWLDDWTGYLCCTVYLPDRIYKWEAPEPKYGTSHGPEWTRRIIKGEEWGGTNQLGDIPFGELANRPRMLQPGASELQSVVGIQDRINKTIADRMMTQEYAAFPQRWVTGMEIPVDENGQDIAPFNIGQDKILMAEEEKAQFGSFPAASPDGYLKAAEADVRDIAAITSTPPHYLLGSMVNLSAEALKAAEAGLIHKVYQRRRHLEEGLERTMRLAGIASSQARIVWKSPEWRTEGELVDALVKMSTLGVPREVLWERWGATPQEIERWRRLSEESLQRAMAGDLAAEYGPKPPVDGASSPAET